MSKISVSAIVAVYNGERFIGEALESILGQSQPVDEIIVVDDGSTDCSAEIVNNYDVRYIHQENAGQSIALNVGIKASRGSFLAFLDADDVWVPTRIEAQLLQFEQDPTLDLVYGHAKQFFGDCHPAAGTEPSIPVIAAHLPSSLLGRRQAIEQVGPFEGKTGNMVDWYARAVESGVNIKTMADVMYQRRIHDDNIGVRERERRNDYLNVVRAALQRRSAESS